MLCSELKFKVGTAYDAKKEANSNEITYADKIAQSSELVLR